MNGTIPLLEATITGSLRMKRLTVAAVLALSVTALPAMAACPGKKHEQNAAVEPAPTAPVVQTPTTSA